MKWTREQLLEMKKNIHLAVKSLSDDDAIKTVDLFPIWEADKDYIKNDRVRWNEFLYKLVPDTHHSQSDWTPDIVPAIWVRIDEPGEEYPEWRQPQGAHDAYEAGAKVSHNNKHWINIHGDGNVWEPGVYGWKETE